MSAADDYQAELELLDECQDDEAREDVMMRLASAKWAQLGCGTLDEDVARGLARIIVSRMVEIKQFAYRAAWAQRYLSDPHALDALWSMPSYGTEAARGVDALDDDEEDET